MVAKATSRLQEADGAACRAIVGQGGLVLVDFWSEHCGPCRSLVPVLEDLAGKHPDLTVVKVEVESNDDLAEELNVQSVPSLILFKQGAQVDRLVGKTPYVVLERMVRKHA